MPGTSMWDERYAESHVSYGMVANDFLRAVAGCIPEGPVLVLAAGEGRNAVFLAERGHEVSAMDQSPVAMANAADLASQRGVALHTEVADLGDYDLGESRWAGIVGIWTHVPPELRRRVLTSSVKALRPGGALVLEHHRSICGEQTRGAFALRVQDANSVTANGNESHSLIGSPRALGRASPTRPSGVDGAPPPGQRGPAFFVRVQRRSLMW